MVLTSANLLHYKACSDDAGVLLPCTWYTFYGMYGCVDEPDEQSLTHVVINDRIIMSVTHMLQRPAICCLNLQ